jgi:hypothetical protein
MSDHLKNTVPLRWKSNVTQTLSLEAQQGGGGSCGVTSDDRGLVGSQPQIHSACHLHDRLHVASAAIAA